MAHDFGAANGLPTPRPVHATQPSGDDRPRLRMAPQPKFALRHQPANWELWQIDGETYWLPQLQPFAEVGGANGIKVIEGVGGQKARLDTSLAEVRWLKEGWTTIPYESVPDELLDDGIPGRSYCVAYDGYQGTVHLLRWDRPVSIGAHHKTDMDHEGYARYRLSLVRRGIVAPPQQVVIDHLVSRMEARLKNLSRNAHVPLVAKQLAATEAQIAAATKTPGADSKPAPIPTPAAVKDAPKKAKADA